MCAIKHVRLQGKCVLIYRSVHNYRSETTPLPSQSMLSSPSYMKVFENFISVWFSLEIKTQLSLKIYPTTREVPQNHN